MKFSGPLQLTAHIFRTEGVPGFFRGFTGTLLREVPGYFCFFYGYEIAKNCLTRKEESKDDLGAFRLGLCGGFAGVCLWSCIFPFDVVKSRSQLTEGKSLSFSKTFVSIFRNEGIGALYKGLLPTVIRTIPATGCLFVSYEYSRKFMMYCCGAGEPIQ